MGPGSYSLRWRYDFKNREAVFGMWDSSAIAAWNKNKEGLVRASIEGKHRVTRKTVTLAQCDGHKFRNFQWVGTAKMDPNIQGSVTPTTTIIGAKILTTDDEILVLNDGYVTARPLTTDEKSINFATFGR